MCEKRGTVVLIQSGDPEISGAIARGVLAGRQGKKDGILEPDQIGVVQAEIDRQRIAEELRETMGNGKTPEDYGVMVTRVRGLYGRYTRPRGPVGRALGLLLGVYGLIVYAVSAAVRGCCGALRP